MALKTKGHQLMLSPAASPEADCSTAPIRERQEAIWKRPQPGQHTPALICYIKPGYEEGLWLWLLLTQKPAADLLLITALLFKMAACATIKVNTKLKIRAIIATGTKIGGLIIKGLIFFFFFFFLINFRALRGPKTLHWKCTAPNPSLVPNFMSTSRSGEIYWEQAITLPPLPATRNSDGEDGACSSRD